MYTNVTPTGMNELTARVPQLVHGSHCEMTVRTCTLITLLHAEDIGRLWKGNWNVSSLNTEVKRYG
jgi:hypothetical protein